MPCNILPARREGATAYICRDAATGTLVSSVFLLENASGGEPARPRGTAADKAAVGLTPEAQLATMGEAAVRRSSIFGAATTAARVEDTAAAGWGRHKYVGMFGTHPDYQQRGIGAAVLSYLNAEADKLGLPVFLYTANVRCA